MHLIRDLLPLVLAHGALLLITLLLGPGNVADAKSQAVWLLFLTTGWLTAPSWSSVHLSFMDRYLRGMITSVALFSVLIPLASVLHWPIGAMVILWLAALAIAATWRLQSLRSIRSELIAWPDRRTLCGLFVLMVFAVCVYRTPRSNDIFQFMLQQQDMLQNDTLQPTSIGMAALGVDEVMPRWRASYWHALPVLIAKASGIAVDQVLLRYATIPVAFSVLLCLTQLVRRLGGRAIPMEIALLAILGPVLVWFRNETAFNYSFRLTNNFLLDKDFALFFLVPATLWLASGILQGRKRFAVVLIAWVPALLRFHPMTAVYLLLLVAPTIVLSTPRLPRIRFRDASMRRSLGLAFAASALFVAVLWIGDAQSYHDKIRQIIALDFQLHLTGRPLHYWSGFYNSLREAALPEQSLPSDTTAWISDRLQLRPSLLTGCGLLLMTHVCVAVLTVKRIARGLNHQSNRVLAAGALVLLMLWGIQIASGWILTRYPHYTAGFERLHWFAYPPALCVIARTLTELLPKRPRQWAAMATLAWILLAAILFRFDRNSPLHPVRGLNNMLDTQRDAEQQRRRRWTKITPDRTLDAMKPSVLREEDRVLLLDPQSTQHYWLTRQGVFWSDPYVEAFAWHHRGDDFLNDRRMYYRLLDHQSVTSLPEWIEQKGISLIVDPHPEAETYWHNQSERQGLQLRRVGKGIWRVE